MSKPGITLKTVSGYDRRQDEHPLENQAPRSSLLLFLIAFVVVRTFNVFLAFVGLHSQLASVVDVETDAQ